MFFTIKLQKEIVVHPRFFSNNLKDVIIKLLMQEVVCSCDGRYGFIIAVLNVSGITCGELEPRKGFVKYFVDYEALILRPLRGEVFEAKVTEVTEMGMFADAGAVKCFISKHCISGNMKFMESEKPMYVNSTKTRSISKDDKIRMRAIGVRVDNKEIFVVGSIIDNYLGKLEQI